MFVRKVKFEKNEMHFDRKALDAFASFFRWPQAYLGNFDLHNLEERRYTRQSYPQPNGHNCSCEIKTSREGPFITFPFSSLPLLSAFSEWQTKRQFAIHKPKTALCRQVSTETKLKKWGEFLIGFQFCYGRRFWCQTPTEQSVSWGFDQCFWRRESQCCSREMGTTQIAPIKMSSMFRRQQLRSYSAWNCFTGCSKTQTSRHSSANFYGTSHIMQREVHFL